jgi:hypothetical protein
MEEKEKNPGRKKTLEYKNQGLQTDLKYVSE